MTTDEARKRAFAEGVKYAVTWLHGRANEMNDEHAKAVLNSAAFHLGRHKADMTVVLNQPQTGTPALPPYALGSNEYLARRSALKSNDNRGKG